MRVQIRYDGLLVKTASMGKTTVAQGNVVHSENKESPLSLPSPNNVTK